MASIDDTFDSDAVTEAGADKTKGFFGRFTLPTIATSSTVRPFLTLVLGLNPDALPMGETMIMTMA